MTKSWIRWGGVLGMALGAGVVPRPGLAGGELDPDVFVASYYRANNPSLGLASDQAAQSHWISTGIAAGLRGSSNFSATEYRSTHPTLTSNQAAIDDWVARGRKAGEPGRVESAWSEFHASTIGGAESPAAVATGDRVESLALPNQRTGKIVVKVPAPADTSGTLQLSPPAAGASVYDWLKSAVTQAISQGAREIRIPLGTYTVQIPAGVSGAHWNLAGLRDVVIDGDGSTLVFTQSGRVGLSLTNNERVLVRNLKLDSSLRIATAGVIEHDTASGQKVLRYVSGSVINAETTVIRAVSPYTISSKRFAKSPTVEVYYDTSNRPTYDAQAGVFRSAQFSGFFAGQQVLARHYLYDGHAIYVSGATTNDISFDNVTIHSGPSMGFVFFQAGRGFRVSNCKVIGAFATAGRYISTAADALHVSSIEGDLIVENSEFAHMGDDGINIESKTARVSQVSPGPRGGLTVVFPGNNVRVASGNQLSFYHDGMGAIGSATVSSVSTASGTVTAVLDRVVPGLAPGSLVRNPAFVSGRYLIQSNNIHDHRARGMLLQAPNGVVRSNTLSNQTLNAINLTSDGRSWFEGAGAQGVVLSSNTISAPGWAPTTPQIGALSIYSEGASGLAVSPQHGSILISGNTISQSNGPAIFISSARGVEVQGNTIQSANRLWLGNKYGVSGQASLAVTRSRTVRFSGNTRTGGGGAISVDATSTGDLVLQAGY